MVQLVKSTKDFDIFGAEPWHRQGEHRKFKSRSDFGRCAILKPATALFRFILASNFCALCRLFDISICMTLGNGHVFCADWRGLLP
jgi:hypothetical protein